VVDTGTTTDDSTAPVDSAKTDSTTADTTPVDSGPACDKPAGGLPCDPKSIYCNGAGCDTTTHYCCAASATSQSCVTNATKCADNSLHCDEASDCASGQICCFVAKSLSSGDTMCATTCSGGLFNIQICRTNSECGAGKSCILQSCGGTPIQACGKITGCT
jgi:hypothetical protein